MPGIRCRLRALVPCNWCSVWQTLETLLPSKDPVVGGSFFNRRILQFAEVETWKHFVSFFLNCLRMLCLLRAPQSLSLIWANNCLALKVQRRRLDSFVHFVGAFLSIRKRSSLFPRKIITPRLLQELFTGSCNFLLMRVVASNRKKIQFRKVTSLQHINYLARSNVKL